MSSSPGPFPGAIASVSPAPLPELLAPAGTWECAKAAVENGADAIYFGLDRFNARMRAHNFTEADLPELMAFLHGRGVKGYVTLNTLVFTSELPAVEQYLRSLMGAGVDAAIVQDVGLCSLIRHLSPDFPIHGSTQMTITSGAGVAFAQDLGCDLVVLARECAIAEIQAIQEQLGQQRIAMPLEVFVHGALCVAYSGQCLTSEALGGRSANRGECAQACRMPYELIVDGKPYDLGDRQYLLSPQDLSGLGVLPALIQAGVMSLKIEGRLKTPEYVASVTQVYRQALDRLTAEKDHQVSSQDQYQLEMAFSRGLYSGWLEGINNQKLVHGRFGKKRGVYLGQVEAIGQGRDPQVVITLEAPLKPGDGVVFDHGNPGSKEEGGRVYGVVTEGKKARITFGRRDLRWQRIQVGDRLWKTSDPEWEKTVRQSFAGDKIQYHRPLDLEIHGHPGSPLTAIARDQWGHIAQTQTPSCLESAHSKPLTTDFLRKQLGRLGNTPFKLGQLHNHLEGAVMVPVSELNQVRRTLITELEAQRTQPQRWQLHPDHSHQDLLPASPASPPETQTLPPPRLRVLVRHLAQLEAVLETEIPSIYCELENPRRYKQAVAIAHGGDREIWVAPPRIFKPGEDEILALVRSSGADGYLVRNYDHLRFFQDAPMVGDFSLNVANPITARHFRERYPLQRLTASYDLNIHQLQTLLHHTPPQWFEITIHQHMPMFHMEHCVFCAFLSTGTDYTNCGRPCESHGVKLRDRAGADHILMADEGCRNTVFNGTAQTGAEYVHQLIQWGARDFRLEFLQESPGEVIQTIASYQQLLGGDISGAQLWQTLKLQNQLGVTRGSLE